MVLMKMPFENCRTDGERLVYNFFKEFLSEEFIIWSNVELNVFAGNNYSSTEIDFLIFHKQFGVFLLSVKDWRINQVSSIGPNNITVNGEMHNNPLINAKQQFYTLKQRLQLRNELRDFEQRLMSPINIAIVFPFIDKNEWENKMVQLNSQDIIPEKIILFKDKFENDSLLKDRNRAINYFDNIRATTGRFPCRFEEEHILILDQVFGVDDNYIEPQGRQPTDVLDDDYLIELDNKQKEIANTYLERMYQNPGPLIIKGIAGSGKTIILLHLFSQIARDPEMKILYVGRQRELVSDFKRKLINIGVIVDSPNYEIEIFFQLFRKFCPQPEYDHIEKKWGSIYPEDEEISNYINEHLSNVTEEYDFVLIDEGHNLPDSWLRFLIHKCKGKESGNIIYVEDFEQNIYQVNRNFSTVGLNVSERSYELLTSYRNTYEIAYFACQLTNKYRRLLSNELKELRHGAVPEIIFDSNIDIIAKFVNKLINNWIEDQFKLNDIAIIYPSLKKNEEREVFLSIIKLVSEETGFKFSIHYTANRIRNMFDSEFQDIILSRRDGENENNSDAINLITSFSSQGISYKCVIVIMDNFESQLWQTFKMNLIYITLTRATHNLVLVFSQESETYSKALEIVEQMRTNMNI